MNKIAALLFYLNFYPFRSGFLLLLLILSALLEFVSLSLFVPILDFIQKDQTVFSTTQNQMTATILSVFNQLRIELNLFNLLLLVFSAVVLQVSVLFLQNKLTAELFFPIRKRIRDACFANLMDSSLGYFTQKRSGETVNIMTERIDTVGYAINIFVLTVADGLLVAAYLLFALFISWKVSVLVLAVAALKVLLTTFFVHRSRQLGKEWLERGNQQTSRLLESLQGIRLIKSLSREDFEKKRYSETTDEYARVQIRYTLNEEWMKFWDGILGPLAFLVIILVSVEILNIEGSYILVYLLTLMKMIPKLTKLNVNRNQLNVNLANTEAILDLLKKDGKPRVKTGEHTISTFQSNLTFETVQFQYQAEPVLNQISFQLRKGERLAIVGASGSGKSTLINLLLHLYDPTSGRILVDGIDLKELSLDSWHSLLGFVDQDTFLFNDTVYNNILYGRLEATEEEVAAAAKKAHIHDFVMTLQAGYQTILGERGVKFSGGQRQRIAIARAIIKKPQILIFDEATSSLDSISEEMIRESIDEISRECTTILVAHRLSTVRSADKIMVLEKGRILEVGNHAQLLALNGKYREYHEAQAVTTGIGEN